LTDQRKGWVEPGIADIGSRTSKKVRCFGFDAGDAKQLSAV